MCAGATGSMRALHNQFDLDIPLESSRLTAYADIDVPCLVIGFADNLRLPPHLSREVADGRRQCVRRWAWRRRWPTPQFWTSSPLDTVSCT
jgi:hypothetical protein